MSTESGGSAAKKVGVGAGLLAAIGTAAAVISAASDAGWIGRDKGSTSPSAPPSIERTAVDLVYTGDNLGCSLSMTVNIGGQTAQPTGSRYTISGVPVGSQPYTVRGVINCTAVGSCNAHGSGNLEISPGATYRVVWLNTGPASCDVTLSA